MPVTFYRRILVPLTGAEGEIAALETAFAFARRFASHVDAMAILPDTRDAVAFVGEGMTSAMIDQIMSAASREAVERGNRMAQAFEALRAKFGYRSVETPHNEGSSARFLRRAGREDDIIAEQGRLSDLIVMPKPVGGEDAEVSLALEAALRETGRPVMVVPRAMDETVGKRVAIAWNGSVEVCSAIAHAKPMLRAADEVLLLSVAEDTPYGAAAEEAVAYLAWQGVKAKSVALQCSERAQGPTLLAAARDHGSDLMVQGAYTRSHMRRLFFGGVTAAVLAETAIPVFMTH